MFRFFPEKKPKVEAEYTFQPEGIIPNHVAVIMDGNGRWAQNRRLPRVAGHKEGMNTVKRITKIASKMGIKVLTLYAFSTENWKRPNDEVNYLMQLPVDFFDTFVPELVAENVKVNVMGYMDQLPEATYKSVVDAMKATEKNTGMILNFALNYGGRAEIISAVTSLVSKAEQGKLGANEVTEELISQELMTATLGSENQDPDLLIRTSGEERISNFLLWQIAYSELYFTDTAWPDFDQKALEDAVAAFQNRNRRYGGLKK